VHRKVHQDGCTHWLRKDIAKRRAELQVLEGQGCCSECQVAEKELELAGQHTLVAELLQSTLLASNYRFAEEHFKQALKIDRKLAALAKRKGSTDDGIFVDNSIATLMDLGHLYRNWHKEGEGMEAYQDALDSMRDNMSLHGSTPWRQETLADILAAQGQVHNRQYYLQGSGPDKSKCLAAKALGEDALAIHRALNAQTDELVLDLAAKPDQILNHANRQQRTAAVLLDVARSYMHLEMFDEARRAVQEALDLSCHLYGNESEDVAGCYSQVAMIIGHQAIEIRKSISQSASCCSPGTRVLVEGLQNQAQYNGLKGVVLSEAVDSRLCVRLYQDNMDLRLKVENVRPLIVMPDERKVLYAQLQDLTDEQIVSSREYLRIQLKVKGVKHFNTAVAHNNLGIALSKTYKPYEMLEAVAMLTKAAKSMRRVAADDDPHVLQFSQTLKETQETLTRFEEDGVLSALPCWWHPSSRQEDAAKMALVFTSLHDTFGSDNTSISSETMQHGLRMHGLLNFTASSSDPVSG